jgi:hypothetical protein
MQPALNNNTRGESPENLQAAANVRSQNQTYSHAKEQEVIAVGSKRLAEKSKICSSRRPLLKKQNEHSDPAKASAVLAPK